MEKTVGIKFTSLRDCFTFLNWLKNKKEMHEPVANKLHDLLEPYYKNIDRHKINSDLSKFLSNVNKIYGKLVYVKVDDTASFLHEEKLKSASNIVYALLECLPKFLAAMYYLWYCVNPTFEALGGGGWKLDWPGWEKEWYYGSSGGELQEYLRSNDSKRYSGLIPGGFNAREVKYWNNISFNYEYRQGFNMANDLKNIFEKHDGQFLRDVFATSVLPQNSGADTPNTANAVGLVGVFCDIVMKEDSDTGALKAALDEDIKRHGKCINWQDLKSHCQRLKEAQINQLFNDRDFNHTGQSQIVDQINKKEFAKETARWLRGNLDKVRANLQRISTTYGVIHKTNTSDIATYFTQNVFPYGFIFGFKHHETRSKNARTLLQKLRYVIDTLKEKHKGILARLVEILNGGKCPTPQVSSPNPRPRPAPAPPPRSSDGGNGVAEKGGDARGRRPGAKGSQGSRRYIRVKGVKKVRKVGKRRKVPTKPPHVPGPMGPSASPYEQVVSAEENIDSQDTEDHDDEEDSDSSDSDDEEDQLGLGDSGMENLGNYSQPQDVVDKAKQLLRKIKDARKQKKDDADAELRRKQVLDEHLRQWQEYQDTFPYLEGNSAIPPEPVYVWLDGDIYDDGSELLRRQEDFAIQQDTDIKLYDMYEQLRNVSFTGTTADDARGNQRASDPQVLAHIGVPTGRSLQSSDTTVQMPLNINFTGQAAAESKGASDTLLPQIFTAIGYPLDAKKEKNFVRYNPPPACTAPSKLSSGYRQSIAVRQNKHPVFAQAPLAPVTAQFDDPSMAKFLNVSGTTLMSSSKSDAIVPEFESIMLSMTPMPDFNVTPIPDSNLNTMIPKLYLDPLPPINLEVADAYKQRKILDPLEIDIHVPNRTVTDPSYDINLAYGLSPLPDVQPLESISPSIPTILLNLKPPEVALRSPRTDNTMINTVTLEDKCDAPWITQTHTHDPTEIPETELFPSEAPRTAKEMLVWMAGLRNAKQQETLKQCINNAFNRENDDASDLRLSVNGAEMRPENVLHTIKLVAMFAASVLSAVAPKWRVAISSVPLASKDSDQSKDPDCCALLCQLRDYVYTCCHQLAFLKSQCNRKESEGGWQDCQYGFNIKGPSPLQAFLTDASESKFKTHPFDPGDICLMSRVNMGFSKEDLPTKSQNGEYIFTILTPTCGGDDPLLTLSSYLNCLTHRTPRTTGELVSFFHNLGNTLHDASSQLSPLGSALSKPHGHCPGWDRLGDADLNAIKDVRGSAFPNSIHDQDHPMTLSTLLGCGINNFKCPQLTKPITYRAYALYSSSFVHTYLSWTVYLTDRLWESLLKLQDDLNKLQCSMFKPLHQCDKALPLLYSHGITPPDGALQSSLTCSEVIAKLREVVNGETIARLMTSMDTLLYSIRAPFLYTIVTLWLTATLYIAHSLLYRLDVLRIRSHLLTTKASHLIDVKALLSTSRKMLSLDSDVDYFDDDPVDQHVSQELLHSHDTLVPC
ncbi:Ribosome-binding protein 1 [Babesia ovata]|uniref:Ribosome-binding protein 1 n=1 Tax=Babesia ovata TaxID=189622 RepID=A0A2H6KHK3_9APIC|nr:Ribosome-binding protein 1 [Babesia ovata]GBE62472.1 Ribosome-binding protein 1 [Babesia ovata]